MQQGLSTRVADSNPNDRITILVNIPRVTGASSKPISEEFATKIALFGHSLGY